MPQADTAANATIAPPTSGRTFAPSDDADPWADAISEHVSRGDYDLPMLPRVATEVVQVASGSEVNAARLAELIHQDPALAGAVLRVSNTAAYMARTPTVSLQQAVTRLGFVTLGEIALAASLQSGVFDVGRHQPRLDLLWRHAIATAGFAREIARERRLNVEGGFLCGLLRTIGKPALLQMIANLERERAAEAPESSVDEILTRLHVPVGSTLGERWELPEPVRAVLDAQGDLDAANGDDLEVPILTTAAASVLATALLDPDDDADRSWHGHPSFAALNMYPEDVDAIEAKGEHILDLVASMTA